jgi:hypothetical protein
MNSKLNITNLVDMGVLTMIDKDPSSHLFDIDVGYLKNCKNSAVKGNVSPFTLGSVAVYYLYAEDGYTYEPQILINYKNNIYRVDYIDDELFLIPFDIWTTDYLSGSVFGGKMIYNKPTMNTNLIGRRPIYNIHNGKPLGISICG